ncbi:UNVERIFIED_CONTAM: Adenylate isopentenyltransferase 3, chloroplastic [Sesamum indicum]
MNFSVRGMMNKHQGKDKVVVVLGTTTTGESRLAIDLATRFGEEVINSDKIQVYKGLDIVTNKALVIEDTKFPSKYECCFLWMDVAIPVLHSYVSKRVDQMVDSWWRRVSHFLTQKFVTMIMGLCVPLGSPRWMSSSGVRVLSIVELGLRFLRRY